MAAGIVEKFSVDAKIVDAAELLDHLRRDGERSDGFALIASLSSLRPNRGWDDGDDDSARAKLARFLADRDGQDPLIDCLIVDEAHHLRNSDTMSHSFAKAATGVSDYTLLLSATPINLRREDLRTLLALLDPDTFDNTYTFDLLAAENVPLVAARDKALNAKTEFAELIAILRALPRGELLRVDNQLDQLQRELARPELTDSPALRTRLAAQLEEMSLLGSVVNRTRRRDVNELQVKRRVDHLRWSMGQDEEHFYREASEVVRNHALLLNASERFLLATPQRLIASSLAAACRHWAARARDLSLDDPDTDAQASGPLVSKLAALCGDPARLRALEVADTKLATLLEAISQQRRREPDAKLIVFSSFRVTLDYLADRLRAAGLVCELMHGGVAESRNDILARFAAASGPAVLLTSEVGGEGLDMQFCRSLINYDLPWNPMKVEQRIGRIDRIGQRSPFIDVVSLICANTIEERIYDRLYLRLMEIEQTLGAFEAILGAEIASLEQRLLAPDLTFAEQEAEVERSKLAIEEIARETRELEEEAPGLIAHGDMILAQIEANHRPERRVGASELADYVHEALSGRYPGSRVDDVPGQPGLFDVQLSAAAHLALKGLLMRGGRFRTRLTRDMRIRAAFERSPGLAKSIELVTTVHPLVRLAAQVRREAGAGVAIEPVVSVALPAGTLDAAPGTYVLAVEKWTVDGAVRVDRIVYAAAALGGVPLEPVHAERLIQAALRDGRHCGPAAPAAEVAAVLKALRAGHLAERFDRFVDEEAARHDDRADTGLARLDRQQEKRVRDAQARVDGWKLSGDPGKLRIASAEQGKIDKLVARLDAKRDQLARARDAFSYGQDLIGVGLIRIG